MRVETKIFKEIGNRIMRADARNLMNKVFDKQTDKFIKAQIDYFCDGKMHYFFKKLDEHGQNKMIEILMGDK